MAQRGFDRNWGVGKKGPKEEEDKDELAKEVKEDFKHKLKELSEKLGD